MFIHTDHSVAFNVYRRIMHCICAWGQSPFCTQCIGAVQTLVVIVLEELLRAFHSGADKHDRLPADVWMNIDDTCQQITVAQSHIRCSLNALGTVIVWPAHTSTR